MSNLVVEIPLDALADVPAEGWVVAGAVAATLAWYVVVGKVFRAVRVWDKATHFPSYLTDDMEDGRRGEYNAATAVTWVFSPVLAVGLIGAWAALLVVSVPLNALSSGVVPAVGPVWRWGIVTEFFKRPSK